MSMYKVKEWVSQHGVLVALCMDAEIERTVIIVDGSSSRVSHTLLNTNKRHLQGDLKYVSLRVDGPSTHSITNATVE